MALKDDAKGKAKEAEGKVTGDKSREVEGKLDQAKGKAKDAVDKIRRIQDLTWIHDDRPDGRISRRATSLVSEPSAFACESQPLSPCSPSSRARAEGRPASCRQPRMSEPIWQLPESIFAQPRLTLADVSS